MTPLFKSLLGIGLVGGGAGLSVGGYCLFKESESKTLAEKFKKENLAILDYEATNNSQDNDWNTKLTKYKDNSITNKFTDLTIGSDDSNGLQNLKNKCKEVLGKPIAETKDIETIAKEWCTKAAS